MVCVCVCVCIHKPVFIRTCLLMSTHTQLHIKLPNVTRKVNISHFRSFPYQSSHFPSYRLFLIARKTDRQSLMTGLKK